MRATPSAAMSNVDTDPNSNSETSFNIDWLLLASSSICLYTDEIAGFGTMPLEAMACGTHVVGWTPLGGKEYMTADNGFWAANGDIFQLAELLGIAVEKMITGQLDSEEVQKQYEITLSKYTSETEKNSLLKNFNEYKHERIEELQKIKQ